MEVWGRCTNRTRQMKGSSLRLFERSHAQTRAANCLWQVSPRNTRFLLGTGFCQLTVLLSCNVCSFLSSAASSAAFPSELQSKSDLIVFYFCDNQTTLQVFESRICQEVLLGCKFTEETTCFDVLHSIYYWVAVQSGTSL